MAYSFSSLMWGIPFVGLILSMAFVPLLAQSFWHQHYGKIGAFWVLILLLPLGWQQGVDSLLHLIAHALLKDYVPFIIMIVSLYILAGGMRLTIETRATPVVNVAFLVIATTCASIIGTTGAAMVFIRPFLEMNRHRNIRRHLVVFFIFLVANVGGSLTPIGDPPLFLGFLRGIPFTWPLQNLFLPMVTVVLPLLGIFYIVDAFHYYKERPFEEILLNQERVQPFSLSFEGGMNGLFLAGAIGLILLSAHYGKGVFFSCLGVDIHYSMIWREVGLIGFALLSLKMTPSLIRFENRFNWHPAWEVGKLFAAIFITMSPLILMLQQGQAGPFKALFSFLFVEGKPVSSFFFWITGFLSAFLDNAPTYLVFLNLAGDNILTLTTALKTTLIAVSCGAVFMGALTYIGNAPNFMVKSMAEEVGIKMPSFFGYLLWSSLLLLPLFALVTWLYFL